LVVQTLPPPPPPPPPPPQVPSGGSTGTSSEADQTSKSESHTKVAVGIAFGVAALLITCGA